MLELFAGRMSVSKAFVARGWTVTAIDLVRPAEVPDGIDFVTADVMQLAAMPRRIGVRAEIFGFLDSWEVDFIWASPPCQQFSVWGMRHFFPNPPHPDKGLELFNHTRMLCEQAGVPHVIENVRAAQQFVGKSVHNCGPFHLWGSGVPPLMPQGIIKGFNLGWDKFGKRILHGSRKTWSGTPARAEAVAKAAEIPPELAACVAEYADRITEDVALIKP